MTPVLIVFTAFLPASPPVESAAPRFREVTVDDRVGIGYGLAVADVDGDGKADILLVDKDAVLWYRNPRWEKLTLSGKLTPKDHVCIAARDIDGDGKAEVAVGAEWDPRDTVKSGSVHYLIPPEDRSKAWQPVDLPREPTVHRMRWAKTAQGGYTLIMAPLHGRENRDGQGAGARVLAYRKPQDPGAPWETEVIDDSLHVIHNLEVVDWRKEPGEEVLLAAREGVFHLTRGAQKWERTQLAGNRQGETAFAGASEVRTGRLPGPRRRFLVTIEPFHGNKLVAYVSPPVIEEGAATPLWERREIDETLNEGHALACGDLLGTGSDQVVAGWRKKDRSGKVGIRIYAPRDGEGKSWDPLVLDDDKMACEDLTLADLDGDGRLDVVAAGRDTKNLKIYFNR